jgi:hypothetical protein
MPSDCFICGKHVLGLTGQDVQLDPDTIRWRGAPALLVNEILADEDYGDCHVVCFRQLGRREFWKEWCLRGYPAAVEVDEHTYVSAPPLAAAKKMRLPDEVIVITTDCVVYALRHPQIEAAVPGKAGHLLPVEGEILLDLEALASPHDKELRRLARGPDPAPLGSLLGLLDLADRLVSPEAVENGVLHPLGVDHGRARFRAEYSVLAGEGLVKWCREASRPRP